MDFAKKQLEKYGWHEGKGLGKSENGITTPLKSSLKFDSAGIGHRSSEQFTNNWWENLYNKAAENLNVSKTANNTIQVSVKSPDAVEISTKSYSLKNLKKENNGLQYGSFIKTSKLTAEGTVDLDNKFSKIIQSSSLPKLPTLTDDELFAACNGRTAHKGARHGLGLSGKLSRLEKQEKLLLKKLKKVSLSDETDHKSSKKAIEKKLKKIDDHKNKNKTEDMEEDVNILPAVSFNSPQKNNKKRKKERKRVSFSETVTEYQTLELETNTNTSQSQDLDSSSHSDGSSRPPTPVVKTVRLIKIKDTYENSDNNANILNGDLDEGIDCSDFDLAKEKNDNDLQAKIKRDNKRMKRKLSKLRKQGVEAKNKVDKVGGSSVNTNEEESLDGSEKCVHCTKRKIDIDFDEDCEVEIKKCHLELEHLTKKELKKYYKKQKRMEKRIDKVTNSFNQICKISDIESE